MIEKAYGSIWKDREKAESFDLTDVLGSMTGAVISSGFEQTFMQGMNTMLQAALGGEAEKQKWFVNTTTTLTAPLYPNLLANVSKAYTDDNYMKEVKDLSKDEGKIKTTLINTFKDRMFMGKQLPSKVTIWGDRVERVPDGKSPLYMILGVSKEKEYNQHTFGVKMYEDFLKENEKDPENAKNILPSLPTGKTVVGWDDAKMTPLELEEYQMRVGKLRSIYAEHYVNSTDWTTETLEDRITELTRLYSRATKIVQAEMFDWSTYKQSNLTNWKILDNNSALPVPSKTKKIKDYTLTPQEVEQVNETALRHYAEYVVPFVTENKEVLPELQKVDTETGSSKYADKLKHYWTRSLDKAKKEMSSLLKAKN